MQAPQACAMTSSDTPPRALVFRRRFGSWQLALERMQLPRDETTRRYNGAAGGWPCLIRQLGFDVAYAGLCRRLLDSHGPLREGARMLDCGGGSAALGSAAAHAAGTKLSLHVLDASPNMLRVAADELRRHGLTAEMTQADIARQPYPDGYFDIVVAAHVIEHLPDPRAALAEMTRVLRPGGAMLLVVTRRSVAGLAIQLKWRVHLATPEIVSHWLEDCGLRRVTCEPVGGPPWCGLLSLAFIAHR